MVPKCADSSYADGWREEREREGGRAAGQDAPGVDAGHWAKNLADRGSEGGGQGKRGTGTGTGAECGGNSLNALPCLVGA